MHRTAFRLVDALAKPSFRPTDSEKDRVVKRAIVTGCFFTAVACSLFVAADRKLNLQTVGNTLTAVICVSFCGGLYKARRVDTTEVCSALVFLLVPCFMMVDVYRGATGEQRLWGFFVTFLDFLLICRASQTTHYVLITLLFVWLLFDFVEKVTSFGLYEAAVSIGDEEVTDSCGHPVCQIDGRTAFRDFFSANIIVTFDFFVTRSFANGMFKQIEQMEVVAALFQEIATHMAAFRTDDATSAIRRGAKHLPEGLQQSLVAQIEILDAYRPYLPESVIASLEKAPSSPTSSDRGPGNRTPAAGSRPKGCDPTDFSSAASGQSDIGRSLRTSSSVSRTSPPGQAFRRVDRAVVAHRIRQMPSCVECTSEQASQVSRVSVESFHHLFDAIGRHDGVILHFNACECVALFLDTIAAARGAVRAVAGVNRALRRVTMTAAERTGFVPPTLTAAVDRGPCFYGAVGTAARRCLVLYGVLYNGVLRAVEYTEPVGTVRVSATVLSALKPDGLGVWRMCIAAPLFLRQRVVPSDTFVGDVREDVSEASSLEHSRRSRSDRMPQQLELAPWDPLAVHPHASASLPRADP
eukprot:TRINITY_DN5007_c0_g1_i2.p1 TRINITY_DN5007_c0_g1~~TRINITY_DN5007_c0_g1_i2.p1  ORF type:complete len:581 (+),score=71.48 TRINITY_DN5007_c0_g1_i2:58-1800(+)